MKRITLCLLMVLLGVYTALARQINPEEALSVASDFMNSSELKSSKATNSALQPMKAPGVDANSSVSPYYIFNRGENEGFVIISGDDRAPKILGYSDKGSFNVENLPPQLKELMEQWAIHMNQLPESAPQHDSWNKTALTRAGEGILMETAEWGQYAPFNNLCPTVDGQKAPAGCVATALAIAMKYYNWPDCTRGGVETDYYFPKEEFDFDNYSIDWDVLSDSDNPNFAQQAAQLVYSAGVAAQMIYGPYESGADVFAIDHVLNRFYAYDKDCQFLPRDKFNDNQWISMLIKQLEEVGPVVYSGSGSGGHCFVIDGYDSEGLYHVNWGWNGESNGYFTLDFTLENGMCFGEGQGMIINMKPDKLKKEYSKVWIPNADAYIDSINGSDGWNFMNPDIEEGVPNTFKGPSMCIGDFRGYVRLAIADEEDRIVKFIDCTHSIDGFRYYCPHPGTSITADNLILPVLQDGQRYQLFSQEVPNKFEGTDGIETGYQPAYEPSNDPDDWKMILGGIVNPSYFFANGNPSRITEVKVHIADNLPAYCGTLNTYDKEFSIQRLRGRDCPVVFHMPKSGVKYELRSNDCEGKPCDVLFVTWGDDYDDTFLGFNISMYYDEVDFYLCYEDEGDTRRDKEIPSDLIVENDGLVYKVVDDQLSLIGYDKIDNTVCIPESVSVGDRVLPVRSISDMALAFAPVKNLEIAASTLDLGKYAFAGMSELDAVSIGNLSLLSDHYKRFGFVGSGLKTVCFDVVPKDPYMIIYTTGYAYECLEDIFKGEAGVKDIDFIVPSAPEYGDDWDYFIGLQFFKDMMPVEDMRSSFKSYFIPGLGKTHLLSFMEELPFNICQMWNYSVDRENSIIRLDDVLSNVQIESVYINGVETVADTEGSYIDCSNTDPAGGMDVKVSYVVNGLKKTTHYTPEYNETVESTNLSGVETTFIDSNIIDVYGVNGMLVKKNIDREGLKTLTPGIYLIRQGGEMKKLVIR